MQPESLKAKGEEGNEGFSGIALPLRASREEYANSDLAALRVGEV